jgi:hypothetical protein
MKLLHLLGDEAASPRGVTRASFVNGALRELSVGLCMRVGNGELRLLELRFCNLHNPITLKIITPPLT